MLISGKFAAEYGHYITKKAQKKKKLFAAAYSPTKSRKQLVATTP